MFYDRLRSICESRGTTVTSLLKTLNISTSKGTAWKSGSTPNSELAIKIANYFNVSTDYLLGNEQKEKSLSEKDKLIAEINIELNSMDDDTLMSFKNMLIAFARSKGK